MNFPAITRDEQIIELQLRGPMATYERTEYEAREVVQPHQEMSVTDTIERESQLFDRKLMTYRLDRKREAKLYVYVARDLFNTTPIEEREEAIRKFIMDRAFWFFTYAERGECR